MPTWQTEEQRKFFEENLTSYVHSVEEGTTKYFWSDAVDEWFERWPLSDPSQELIEKEGSEEAARKVSKTKKIEVSIAQQCLVSTQTHLFNSRLSESSGRRLPRVRRLFETSVSRMVSHARGPKSKCT